jgi:hypothetical protein
MACFPLALGFGIAGIAVDHRKLLAILMTIIAGGLVLFYFGLIGVSIICRR